MPANSATLQQRLQAIVNGLKNVATQSNLTSKDLESLAKIFNSLGGEGTFIPKLIKTTTAINQLAGALTNVGASGNYIEKLRTDLFNLAKEYERVGSLQRQLQLIPKDLSPNQQIAASLNIKSQFQQQQKYLLAAAQNMSPQEATGLSQGQIRDTISARATSARLADEEQIKILQAAIAQRNLTAEVENMANIMQTRILSGYIRQKEAIQDVARVQAERAAKEIADAQRVAAVHENFLDRYRSKISGGSGRGVGELTDRVYAATGQTRRPLYEPKPVKDPEVRNIGQILNQYKDLIGTDAGVENLRKRMESLGITNARVTSVTEELTTGVRTFGFSIDRGGNAVSRATIRLDEHGQVMRDVGTRYRSWSSAIQANLIKVVQWGLATGVVYGIMKGFRQVMQEIIEIETELANVQIALGRGAGNLNAVFKEAANVADITSTSIKGVIQGYALAYQAAGSVEDSTLRTATANSLLEESMTLATLAGIDQAQAMDTLVGALRQTGQELTDGRDLLDQWVAVSRESNVSLNTLASTYSIVGATAQGLGITFEQLNALTATLAEATGLSATETGNAVRGIVAGFQTAQAEKVLDRFGIETRKATGELRNFWDLLNEVSTLLSSGAISPAELTEIANAIGGGYRRGAQVQTILEGMARAQQLVNVQMNSGGQTAEALETKMATLQSAITRLGNAFTGVAQTLGTEGGFLSTAKVLVEILTSVVGLMDSLAGGLGKATPALLAFGAAWLVLGTGPGKSFLGGQAGTLLSNLAYQASTTALDRRLTGKAYSSSGQEMLPQSYTRGGAWGAIRGGVQQKLGGTDPLALAAGLIPGIITAINTSKTTEAGTVQRDAGYVKAGAQIAGGIVGSLVGGIGGALIGSAIAGAFADTVVSGDIDIGARIAEHFVNAQRELEEGSKLADDAKTLQEQSQELQQTLPLLVRAFAGITATIGNIGMFVGKGGGSQLFQSPETTIAAEDILTAYLQGTPGVNWIQNLITDEQRQALQDIISQAMEEGIGSGNIAGAFRTSVEAGTPEMAGASEGLVDAFIEEARRQFILGEIDITDLLNISDLTPETVAPALSQLKEALSLAGVNTPINELVSGYLDLDEASKQLLDTASRQVITNADLVNYYKTSEGGLDKLAGATDKYNDSLANLEALQRIIAQRQILSKVKERPIVQLGELGSGQIEAVRREAERIRNETALAYADGSTEGADLWIKQLGDVLIQTGEGIGKEFWGEFFDQDPEFINQAIENLGLEDAIKSATNFGLQDLRDQMGVADFPALMRRYGQVKSAIQGAFPDYKVNEEPQGLILKDGFRTIHADNTLLNLAMQDLIDVNEQQLEGVWNLPSGMTAFVPVSSLFSRNLPSGGTQAAGPFDVAGDSATSITSVSQGGSIAPIQAEVERLAALIAEVQTRISDPRADRATIEEGRYYQDQLSMRLTQLLDEQGKILESRGKGAVTLDGTPISDVAEPATPTSILEQIRDTFQLENKIELSANIRLVVDGRTLANVVKEYLFSDLVTATDRALGGGSGGYIIEGH